MRNGLVCSSSKRTNAAPEVTSVTPKSPTNTEVNHVVAVACPKRERVPRLSSLSDRAKRFMVLFKKGYDVTIISRLLDGVACEVGSFAESKHDSAFASDQSKGLERQYVETDAAEFSAQPTTVSCPAPMQKLKIIPGVIYDELTHYRGENGSPHYPDDWDARRDRVKQRDGFCCQVNGCPNIESLDVHHIEMIANGGSHSLDNLTCLCIVHHWMLPDHELVSERLPEKNLRRFTMRRAHWRHVNGQRIKVKATFERYVKCSVSDCESIRDNHDMRCPKCESGGIHFAVFGDYLVAGCLGCRSAWKMRRLLAEEVGTLLGRILKSRANAGGRFHFELDNLPDSHCEQTVLCNRCADLARIGIFEPRDGQFGAFHGCTNFWRYGCKNSHERQEA